MTLRALALASIKAAPVVAGAVAASLFAARELGMLLPDSIAMGLAMFPGGYLAGFAAGLGARRRVASRS